MELETVNGSAVAETGKVDRTKECPMLVRLFCREGGHHPPDMFALRQNLPLEDEVIIYTWKDASLKELTNLIKEIHPDSKKLGVTFSFRLIQRTRGRVEPGRGNEAMRGVAAKLARDVRVAVRDIGRVHNNPNLPLSFTAPKGADAYFAVPTGVVKADQERTLEDIKFVQGDFLDVAIHAAKPF